MAVNSPNNPPILSLTIFFQSVRFTEEIQCVKVPFTGLGFVLLLYALRSWSYKFVVSLRLSKSLLGLTSQFRDTILINHSISFCSQSLHPVSR